MEKRVKLKPRNAVIGDNSGPPLDSSASTSAPVKLEIPSAFLFLFQPKRYKVAYGGRGGAKSWAFARALVAIAHTKKVLVLCVREYQNSISDSVLRLLAAQIELMGLAPWFDVQKTTIISKLTGSEFIFKGLHRNSQEIKSTEGVDICWVEEAQSVSEDSWLFLIPTIRGSGEKRTEIWVSFNPQLEDDPTYKRFVLAPARANAFIVKVGWQDNPWFTADLDEERRYMLQADPDAYEHVWEGHVRRISEATILRSKFQVMSFNTPTKVDRFFYGVDWGFSKDPTVLVRCFIMNKCLYVDYEAWGIGIDIDQTKRRIFEAVPGALNYPVKADSARPETISYMRRQGVNIAPAEKWKGSIEDGIAHLRGFDMIYIHERCTHVAQDARLYSYKVDKKTNEILPTPEDKNNDCIDALRYALDGYIQKRGGLGVWGKLIGKG